jgi:hypothetical protein
VVFTCKYTGCRMLRTSDWSKCIQQLVITFLKCSVLEESAIQCNLVPKPFFMNVSEGGVGLRVTCCCGGVRIKDQLGSTLVQFRSHMQLQ